MKQKIFMTVAVILTAVLAGCDGMDTPDPDVYDVGVVIGGYTWATRNVDTFGKFAALPQDLGMYYQWNRTTPWQTTGDVTGWDASTPAGNVWAAENDPCPAGWHVPTRTELEALNAVEGVWGVQGGVSGRSYGFGTNTIFLPGGGYRVTDGSFLNKPNNNNLYWASSIESDVYATSLAFTEMSSVIGSTYRTAGALIRCVKN
jgi:Fibrobacter succinogenes major domain (Fib_succ_major).